MIELLTDGKRYQYLNEEDTYSLFVDGKITRLKFEDEKTVEKYKTLLNSKAVQQALSENTREQEFVINEDAKLEKIKREKYRDFNSNIFEFVSEDRRNQLLISKVDYRNINNEYSIIKFKERDKDIKDAILCKQISFLMANVLIVARDCCEKYKDEENIINNLYKHYKIPKKKKGEYRDIYEPVQEFKIEMKNLNNVLLKTIDTKLSNIETNQYAYIKDRNIVKNAEIHKNNKTVVKVDIEKYFESISKEYCERHIGFLCQDKNLLDEFFTYIIDPNTEGLYMGNPISGTLANLVMFKAASILNIIFKDKNMKISIYSDDITVSTNGKISKEMVTNIVSYVFNKLGLKRLKIKESKTKKIRNQNRTICGVTINHNDEITIRRKDYDRLRVTLYKLNKGEPINIDLATLKGRMNFYLYVDETGKYRKLIDQYKDILVKKNIYIDDKSVTEGDLQDDLF